MNDDLRNTILFLKLSRVALFISSLTLNDTYIKKKITIYFRIVCTQVTKNS